MGIFHVRFSTSEEIEQVCAGLCVACLTDTHRLMQISCFLSDLVQRADIDGLQTAVANIRINMDTQLISIYTFNSSLSLNSVC